MERLAGFWWLMLDGKAGWLLVADVRWEGWLASGG